MRLRPEFGDWIASMAARRAAAQAARQTREKRRPPTTKSIYHTILVYLIGGVIAFFFLFPLARPQAIWGANWVKAAVNSWLCAGPHYKALCRPLLWVLPTLTYIELLAAQLGAVVWLLRRTWRWLTSRWAQAARADDSPVKTTAGVETEHQRQLDRLRLRTARVEEQVRRLEERVREFETRCPHVDTAGPVEPPEIPATEPPDPQHPEPRSQPREPRPRRTREQWAIRLRDYHAQDKQPLYVTTYPSDKTPEDSEVAVTTTPAKALQFPNRETAQAYWSDLFLGRPQNLRIVDGPEPPISVTIFRAHFCRVPIFNQEAHDDH